MKLLGNLLWKSAAPNTKGIWKTYNELTNKNFKPKNKKMKIKNTLSIVGLLLSMQNINSQAVYNGSNKHVFTTNFGTIEIGPFNSSWGHIYTDRPKVIFNKDVYTTTNAFSSYNDDLILKTKGTERIRINDDTGNIGIGTSNPQEKLQIKGKLYLNTGLDDDGIYWARHYMTMGTIPGSYNHNVFMLKPGGSSNGYLFSVFEMYTANSETNHEKKVRIHSSGDSYFNGGYVGIGTTTPDSQLTVKGDIHAEEVKVDLSVPGPDYVFKEDYDLKSLEEVQNYINKKGHLPNIPSAQEMEENGIQLGEMNMKLLEKIEELTLYILQQEKRLRNLENNSDKN
ncbi:MAG: hypothetical protein ABJN84_07125 [Flavobacteriaceae bacterium]